MPVPQPRAAGEVRVRRVDLRRRDRAEDRARRRSDELAGADRRLADRDGVVDVVGRLRRRVVVERHPGHVPDGLRGHERAVVRRGRGVHPEPALRGAVTVRVHSRPARVVDPDGDRLAFGHRARRRDHQLVRRALQAVLRGVAHLGRARRRVGVGRADGIDVRDRVRGRVRVIRSIRVAGVGRLLERECRRLAVDRDRAHGQVRTRRRAGHRGPLEVEAEVGQTLRRPDRQVGVRPGRKRFAACRRRCAGRCGRSCSRRCPGPDTPARRRSRGCARPKSNPRGSRPRLRAPPALHSRLPREARTQRQVSCSRHALRAHFVQTVVPSSRNLPPLM